jgi:hypothetical protein
MNDDPRCCGSGTCIIDANGHCWCGQRWDGQKMCHPAAGVSASGAGGGGRAGTKDHDSEAGEDSGDGGGGGD